MADDFLTLRDVGLAYADNGHHVLSGISLTIPAGAFVALVGSSGVGKSTLLRVIGGLLRPSAGAVRLMGEDPRASAAPIGIVFQRDNLMPWRTVAENVRLPLELIGNAGERGSGGAERRRAFSPTLSHRARECSPLHPRSPAPLRFFRCRCRGNQGRTGGTPRQPRGHSQQRQTGQQQPNHHKSRTAGGQETHRRQRTMVRRTSTGEKQSPVPPSPLQGMAVSVCVPSSSDQSQSSYGLPPWSPPM